MAWQVEWLILWKRFVKMLTHIHMMVYTWWCWHIYKGDEVGVDVDQLGDETKARRVRNFTGGVSERWSRSDQMLSLSVRSVVADRVQHRSSDRS